MHQNVISMKNAKRMHFHDLFTMYEDYNLMQHSQHCQENFNLLEEPAYIARAFREGIKMETIQTIFHYGGGGSPLPWSFFYQKMGVLVQTTALSPFYCPFYLKNAIRGGRLTEYALNLFQFYFIPVIFGFAQR